MIRQEFEHSQTISASLAFWIAKFQNILMNISKSGIISRNKINII